MNSYLTPVCVVLVRIFIVVPTLPPQKKSHFILLISYSEFGCWFINDIIQTIYI